MLAEGGMIFPGSLGLVESLVLPMRLHDHVSGA